MSTRSLDKPAGAAFAPSAAQLHDLIHGVFLFGVTRLAVVLVHAATVRCAHSVRPTHVRQNRLRPVALSACRRQRSIRVPSSRSGVALFCP